MSLYPVTISFYKIGIRKVIVTNSFYGNTRSFNQNRSSTASNTNSLYSIKRSSYIIRMSKTSTIMTLFGNTRSLYQNETYKTNNLM